MPPVVGPGKVNIAFLEEVAAQYVGEPVTVRVQPLVPGLLGVAESEHFRYRIRLNEALSVVQLPEIFFHEIGHLKCGHVPQVESIPVRGVSLTEWRKRALDTEHPDHEMAPRVVEILARYEDEADAWAAEHLSQWEKEHGFFARASFSIHEELAT